MKETTAGAGGEVCADLTGRLPMAPNGSEYLSVALRREPRFGFVKALANKRGDTIQDAMVDMQLLLRGVRRFHSDEGREFMGAGDDLLREHSVLHTTTGAHDPNANSLVEESVGARKRGIQCHLHLANAPVCLWPAAAEHAKRRLQPQQTPSAWTDRRGGTYFVGETCFLGHAECDWLPREKPNSWPPWGCLAFAMKLKHPTLRRGSLDPIALHGIFVVWNRKVPHGIKIATFRDDREIEKVFTSTIVRTRDTGVPFVL